MSKLKIGVIGTGVRGRGLSFTLSTYLNDRAEITAICDPNEAHIALALERLAKNGVHPQVFNDYNALMDSGPVDAVIIASSWELHVPIAVAAMKKGIPCGLEVGGAYDLQQCWDLVNTWEETRTPFMLLENCCFGRYELMVLNMVRKGLFGEVVHCEGSYSHDLRAEIVGGKDGDHYRYDNYLHRNCDNYPTHEIGPIAKVLNIHHGNRFLTLNSVASKSAGLHDYIRAKHADDETLMNAQFNQGDVVTSIIKCANGETVTINLDTTLARYYTRSFTVHGTRALYDEKNNSIVEEGSVTDEFHWQPNWGNAESYLKEHEHPIWKRFLEEGIRGGHGGMDCIELMAFIDCVQNGHDMPVDVYDAAAWMAITVLSEQSISMNGAPVPFPDFTRGAWKLPRKPANPSFYSID